MTYDSPETIIEAAWDYKEASEAFKAALDRVLSAGETVNVREAIPAETEAYSAANKRLHALRLPPKGEGRG